MPPSDLELWRASARGSADAFGELFDRHSKAVYNYCFRRLADWSAAEDLLASVFTEAWRRRAEVRLSGDSLLPWLLGVATNLIRNERRSQGRRRAALARLDASERPVDETEQVAQRIDDQRLMSQILERVGSLSEGEREVLALVVWSEMTYEQASVALGIPVGTVRSRLSRAKARLREPSHGDGHVTGGSTTLAGVSEREGGGADG